MTGVHPETPMGEPAGGRPFPARVTGPTSAWLSAPELVTPPGTPPATAPVTPGQAAYEAYVARMTAATSDITGSMPFQPWGQLPPAIQAAMEASAEAVAAPLRADLADAEALARRWPTCPDGCGCRLGDTLDGAGDADRADCGCDGPCTAECRENGYPDAPSYRDLAVKHAMDENAELRADRDGLRLERAAAIAQRDELRDVIAVTERERDAARKGRDDYLDSALQLTRERDEAREVASKALAANERCAETLDDVQQRHAILKAALQRLALGHKIASVAQAAVIADKALMDASSARAGREQP